MIFKTGDVVRLKSGGPRMTISGDKRMDVLVTCDYFIGNEPQQYVCEAEMLAPAWPEVVCDRDESFGLYDASDDSFESDLSDDLSDEELDALMHVSEVEQYGPR